MTDRRPTAGALAVLLGAAALVAGACGGSAATPPIIYVTPAPTPSPMIVYVTPAVTATPGATSAPEAGASWPVTPTVVDTIVSEGGSTAACSTWRITMHKPVVVGVPAADAMNASIQGVVDGFVADFKSHLDEGGGSGPCTLDGTFTTGIASQTLVGIAFANQVYLGGASTTATTGSINFTAPTGATLELADLFGDATAALSIVSTQSRSLLAAALTSDSDAATIAAGTGADWTNFEKAWVLKPDGLWLTFAQNQVGPALVGTPSIVIPWPALTAVLDPTGPAGEFIPKPGASPSAS